MGISLSGSNFIVAAETLLRSTGTEVIMLNHYSFKSSVDWLKYNFLQKLNDSIKCKMFLLHGKGQIDTFMKTINEPVIMSRYF